MEFSTTELFAALLCSAIGLTFLAGMIKVWFNKRDMKKKTQLANLEAANVRTDREKLVGDRPLDEGDLFGVRAIEAGFFGGVSQSRPSSPSPSRATSVSSIGGREGTSPREEAPPKPSPLRLQPPDHVSKKSSSLPHVSPSPRDNDNSSTTPWDGERSEAWIPPRGDSYSATPMILEAHPKQTISPLPQLKIPRDFEKNALVVPTPGGDGVKSAAASIIDCDGSTCTSPTTSEDQKQPNSPLSIFPQPPSSHPTRPRQMTSHRGQLSQHSVSGSYFAEAPLPGPEAPHQTPLTEPIPYSPDSLQWDTPTTTTAVIRDSVVSKQQVSIYDSSSYLTSCESRPYSIAASSIYSARTSILEANEQNRARSNSPPSKTSRDRTTSPHNARQHQRRSTSASIRYSRQSMLRPNSRYGIPSVRSSMSSLSSMDDIPSMYRTGETAPALSLPTFGSIGEFYDTYYRQSTMQRQSYLDFGKDDNNRLSRVLVPGAPPSEKRKSVALRGGPTNAMQPMGVASETIYEDGSRCTSLASELDQYQHQHQHELPHLHEHEDHDELRYSHERERERYPKMVAGNA